MLCRINNNILAFMLYSLIQHKCDPIKIEIAQSIWCVKCHIRGYFIVYIESVQSEERM